jgi:hypothetical protein
MMSYDDYFKHIPPSSTDIYWMAWDGYNECTKFETYNEAIKFAKKGCLPTMVTSNDPAVEAEREELTALAKEKFFDDLHEMIPVLPKYKLMTMFYFFNQLGCNPIVALDELINILIDLDILEAPKL